VGKDNWHSMEAIPLPQVNFDASEVAGDTGYEAMEAGEDEDDLDDFQVVA